MRFNLPIFIGTFILFAAIVAAALFGYLLPQLFRGFLPVDALTFSLTLFLLVAAVILLYILFRLIKRQQPSSLLEETVSHPHELPLESPFIRRRRVAPQPNEDEVNRELKSRLISLLAGDSAAAERLVNSRKQSDPGMPENWYWERVMADLERDRR